MIVNGKYARGWQAGKRVPGPARRGAAAGVGRVGNPPYDGGRSPPHGLKRLAVTRLCLEAVRHRRRLEVGFKIDAAQDSVTEISTVGPARDLEERWQFFLSGVGGPTSVPHR